MDFFFVHTHGKTDRKQKAGYNGEISCGVVVLRSETDAVSTLFRDYTGTRPKLSSPGKHHHLHNHTHSLSLLPY